MMERRAGQHEPVEQRDRHTGVHPSLQRPQHAAGSRAVEVELLPAAPMDGGDDHWLAVDHEADMADEGLVNDGLDGGAVIHSALGQTLDGGAGRLEGSGHGRIPYWRSICCSSTII